MCYLNFVFPLWQWSQQYFSYLGHFKKFDDDDDDDDLSAIGGWDGTIALQSRPYDLSPLFFLRAANANGRTELDADD